MSIIGRLRKLLPIRSLERGDFPNERGRRVENVDALAAAGPDEYPDSAASVADSSYPPGYVKSYDEGRPRK